MEFWVQLNREPMLTWDSRRRGKKTCRSWSGPVDARREATSLSHGWWMSGPFKSVAHGPLPSCDYLIRRKGIRWTRNDRSRHVQAREDRGIDSMLPNHKRDCIESATGVFSGLPRTATFWKLVRALYFPLAPPLSSAPHEVSVERHTATRRPRRSRWMDLLRLKKKMHAHRQGNPFNLSLCAATRANSCKERKDTPGIAFSGGASPGNEITGLPLKLARPANNRAYYVAFVSTALLSP